MFKGRIWEILAHPAIIGFILWIIIVLFRPVDFSRYRVTHIRDDFKRVRTTFYYRDLDSDGESEMVSVDLNDPERTQIIFYKGNKIYGAQYDLRLQPMHVKDIYFDDYNSDGIYECYVFTANDDSIFLNIIDGIRLKRTLIAGRFIDFRHKALNTINFPNIDFVGLINAPEQKVKDIVFIISTGLSLRPRNVYRFDIEKDILVKSPESGAAIVAGRLSDINNDQIPEILLDVLAPGNLSIDFPFTDEYTWLMILNYNLKFLFTPVRLEDHPARAQLLPLKFGDSVKIVVFRDYYGSEDISSLLCIYDKNGKIHSSKPVGTIENTYARIFPNEENEETFYFLKNRYGEIVEFDSSFRELKKLSIPTVSSGEFYASIDADNDGNPEYLFESGDRQFLVFVTNDFRYSASWKLPGEIFDYFLVSTVLEKGAKPVLFLQTGNYGTFIRFEKNKLYLFKYPVYLSLYFFIMLFITLIARIQKYRLNVKLETERRIAGLQMRAIKNQADPHFMLNVLNAIGSLYATENDRQKADYLFSKYARLIRQTVISSDQITVSLEDELDLIKNYLDLERFRTNNSFKYEIDIATGIDKGLKIPRMLIHTFVENAIKYGIRSRKEGGLIKIDLTPVDNNYQIIIEDNGKGIKPEASSTPGTGRGLKILDELIELYRKLERISITYRMEDLSGYPENGTGLRVIITIPGRKSG